MFRIKKYPRGFVAEIQKRKWYGKKYWTHFISVAGIPSEPWYFSSYEFALDEMLYKIRQHVINYNENKPCQD